MTRTPTGWDIEGPVQTEVVVVWLHDGVLAPLLVHSTSWRRDRGAVPTGA